MILDVKVLTASLCLFYAASLDRILSQISGDYFKFSLSF